MDWVLAAIGVLLIFLVSEMLEIRRSLRDAESRRRMEDERRYREKYLDKCGNWK